MNGIDLTLLAVFVCGMFAGACLVLAILSVTL